MGKNIIANIIGKFWGLFSVFIFVPLYISILGFESYSLISFTLVIAGILAFLDSGLTSTLSRVMARNDLELDEKIRTFKTLETVYVIIVLIVVSIFLVFSNFITENWIKSNEFSNYQVSYFLKLVSFDIALQLYVRFNLGGLLGLEKQVKANIIQVGWGMMRNGVVVLMIIYKPTLETFFIWQAFSSLLFAIISKFALQKELELSKSIFWKFSFEKSVIKSNYKFAGGMLLIAIVAGINTQIDKFTIAQKLPLVDLGYYTLSVALGMGIITIISPISVATLPRFTSLFSQGKKKEAIKLFNSMNLLVSIITFSLMSILIFFPKEILWIWIGDESLSDHAKIFLPFAAIAYSSIAIVYIPFNIAIANGHTKLNNYLGIISLFVTIPGYYFVSLSYGAFGVVVLFCAVQITSNFVYFTLVNKKFLQSNVFITLLNTVFKPLFITLLIVYMFSLTNIIDFSNRWVALLWIGLFTAITICLCSFILMKKQLLASVKFNNKKNP
jgi:O-antigen/teichoic acid export membrane protein